MNEIELSLFPDTIPVPKKKGKAAKDAEGLRNMRMVARNMAFLMKSIALGKEKYGLPEKEKGEMTNFIR